MDASYNIFRKSELIMNIYIYTWLKSKKQPGHGILYRLLENPINLHQNMVGLFTHLSPKPPEKAGHTPPNNGSSSIKKASAFSVSGCLLQGSLVTEMFVYIFLVGGGMKMQT